MRLKTFAALLLIGAAGLAAGCENGKSTKSTSSDDWKDNQIVMTGSHGGTGTVVWDRTAGKPMVSKSEGMQDCPTCMKDASTYYSSGKMDPMCKDCGAKRMVVSPPGTHGKR